MRCRLNSLVMLLVGALVSSVKASEIAVPPSSPAPSDWIVTIGADGRMVADLPRHCGLVTVLDGHPATLAWLGAVSGHRVRSLGVEHFGQTGSIAELYCHYGIDTNAIVAAAQAIAPGWPIRHLKRLAAPELAGA